MPNSHLTLSALPGRFVVCRLDAGAAVPAWALDGALISITRTTNELSIVCPESDVPAGVRVERGWSCLGVQGPLDFALTGILAAIAAPLAQAGVSLFAISTFDTDYVLVKELDRAVDALRQAGHTVEAAP